MESRSAHASGVLTEMSTCERWVNVVKRQQNYKNRHSGIMYETPRAWNVRCVHLVCNGLQAIPSHLRKGMMAKHQENAILRSTGEPELSIRYLKKMHTKWYTLPAE